MKPLSLAFGIVTALGSWTLWAAAAPAATFEALPMLTDADFLDLLDQGLFSEDFVAESRGGATGLVGDFEIDIQDVTPPGPGGPPNPTAQFVWENGQAYDFALTYDGAGSVSYQVGDVLLQKFDVNDIASGINALYIRTRSAGNGSSTLLSQLQIDGMSYGSDLRSDDLNPISYLKITDFSESFTLSGQSTFTWTADEIPRGSQLAYQVKAGYEPPDAPAIPEPMGMSLLSVGMLGGAIAATRRAPVD